MRRLDALRRFLLEGLEHPDIAAELHCVDNPVSIALKRQCDLQHAGAKPMQGLRNIGLAALGRNRERGEADRLRSIRELVEFPECWFEPGNRLGLRTSAIRYRVPSI